MTTLTLHGLDAHLMTELQRRAAEKGHRVEDEVCQILQEALSETPAKLGFGTAAAKHFSACAGEVPNPQRSSQRPPISLD